MVSLFKSKLLAVAMSIVTLVAFTQSAMAGTMTSTGQVLALEGAVAAKNFKLALMLT